MDVGNPSNFDRILSLFDGNREKIRKYIKGFSYSDDETRETILETYQKYDYIACPHTAIGLRAAQEYLERTGERRPVVTRSTAHPVKFREVIEAGIAKRAAPTGEPEGVMEREGRSLPLKT